MPTKKENNTKKAKKKKQEPVFKYEDNPIYRDLKEQLVSKNNYSAYTEDLLIQYMKFCDIEEDLNNDINVRGVTVYWNNGGGQDGWKKNDSIAELNKTNLQKIKLLNFLGIKAPEKSNNSGDDDYEV